MSDLDLPSYGIQVANQQLLRSMRDTIDNLSFIVDKFQNESSKSTKQMTELAQESGKQTKLMLELTKKMHSLTRVIAILTLVMLIGLGIQIYLAIK